MTASLLLQAAAIALGLLSSGPLVSHVVIVEHKHEQRMLLKLIIPVLQKGQCAG